MPILDSLGTTTALDTGTTFTSDWADVQQYPSLVVAVATDQDGVFYVDYSPDMVNVDSTLTRYYNTTDIEAPHRFTNTRRFARIRLTNDSGSNQTYLRIQCTAGFHVGLNAPIDSTLARDFDAIVVRPTNSYHEEAIGRRQGSTLWNKFGYNDDVDSAAAETVWSVGGLYSPPTTAYTLSIVSTSTDDDGDPAGIGANSVVVYGIDENRVDFVETVTLNGQTPVTTTNSCLGVNRMAVALAGSSQTNVGTITVTQTTDGRTMAHMPAGEGTTQQCIYHTPVNTLGVAEELILNVRKLSGGGTDPRVTFKGWAFSPVSNCSYLVFQHRMDAGVENSVILSPKVPFVLTEQVVLYFNAESSVNDVAVNMRFSLVTYKESDAD